VFKSVVLLAIAAPVFLFGVNAVDAKPALMSDTIEASEVKAAQDAWCEALVSISKAHTEGGLAKSKPLASGVIDAAYGYQFGPVAFKPTWAKGSTTFRETSAGALSYFVGGDPALGLRLRDWNPWVKCKPEIFVIQSFGNTANAMGWVHIEAADGSKSIVDKIFRYLRDDHGSLRIVVHRSSKPFVSN